MPAGSHESRNVGWSAKQVTDEAKRVVKTKGIKRYVSLHHHSTFSFLDGFALPEDHVKRAAELDMAAMALTEHGNVSSHPRLEMAAKETGVKPLYGCELYTTLTGQKTKKKNHLTVLAENQEGYRNLMRLVSDGWDNFY